MKMGRKWLTVVLCSLLLLMAMPTSLPALSEEAQNNSKDVMDNYILETIFDKKDVTSFVSGSGKYGYGNAWVNNLSMDLASVEEENLALSMRLYIENNDSPGDISILQNMPFGQIELATQLGGSYLTWQFRTLKAADGGDLQAGWNDILLPFSTGNRQTGFDKDAITFFRVELANMETQPDNHTIRLADVAIVDTSRPAQVEEEEEWDTAYMVGEIPFKMEVTVNGRGSTTPTALSAASFSAIDASKHDIAKLQLMMDIEVENLTHPGDVSVLSRASGQVELSSSGACDVNELSFGVNQLNWRNGQNEYALPLSMAGFTGGEPDYANLNFMRIYMNNWPADFTDTLTIRVSNVRLVDVTDLGSVSTVFSDGMVFQQNKPMKLWGYQEAGETVTARLYRGEELLETQTAVTPADGRWELSFAARAGGYDAYTIEILTKGETVKTIQDVLVGEVWIACGQSNMELKVSNAMDAAEILANADNEYLRIFLEPTYPLGKSGEQPLDPAEDIPGAYWGYGSNSAQVSNTSAIGYTFAKTLQETLDVPVGLINAAIGGTVIEGWLPREAVEEDTAVKQALAERGLYYDADWWPTTAGSMSTLYNQKIGPLAGMNIAGVIWYQGESNSNRAEIYDIELDLLKRSWSEAFGFENGDMPLIFTQVAPYRYDNGVNNAQHLGYLAEAMERGWAMSADKNTAMLTIYDLPLEHMRDGVSSDPIHPREKTPVGERFALSALNMVYGGGEEYTAPVCRSMEVKDSAVYLTFDRVGDGLYTTDFTDSVHGFAIAGADGVYVGAEAEIVDESTVKVWNNRVADPQNVTYAFDNFNQGANLCNSSGIPASPFRTAQAEDTTMKPDSTLTYFTAQDWMWADGDVWVYDSANTEERGTGYRPAFAVSEGAAYTYSEWIMTEGKASLRVEYTDGVTIEPVLSYESLQLDWSPFASLSVKLLNPDAEDKTVSLRIQSNNATYTALTAAGDEAATLSGGADAFRMVTFDLSALKAADGSAADAKTVLKNMTKLTFVVTGGGTVFLDAVSVGLTDAVVDESELNAAEETVLLTAEEAAEVLTALQQIVENWFALTPEAAEAYLQAQGQLQTLLEDESATRLQLTDAVAALVETLAQPELPSDEPEILLGDVNEDGSIDTTDARLTLQYAAKRIKEDKLNLAAADVNGDDSVDTTDARLILQYAAKRIKGFPANS